MISLMAEKAVDAFISCSIIAKDDRDLYVYGFFMLFSKIIYFLWTVFWGALFGVVVESIVFYGLFSILREYAGGIHASSERTCIVSTALSLFGSVLAIWIGQRLKLIVPCGFLLLINSAIIVLVAPLDTEAKRLSKAERAAYKKKSIICLLFVLFLTVISLAKGLLGVVFCCTIASVFEGSLLALGKLLQDKHR